MAADPNRYERSPRGNLILKDGLTITPDDTEALALNRDNLDSQIIEGAEARTMEVQMLLDGASTSLENRLDAVNGVATAARAEARAAGDDARQVTSMVSTWLGEARTMTERIRSLEWLARLTPGDVSDGTMANLLLQAGTLTRQAMDRFFVRKGDSSVHNVYVSPTGSDANDGQSAGTAFRTFQAAFDYLETQGPMLTGTWYVNAAAGTYPVGAGQHTLSTASAKRVVVRGPAAGHPNVPTAIIDGAGGTEYQHGLAASGVGVKVEFRDLKFVGFTAGASDTSRIGTVGDQGADVIWTNVHASGCSWAGIYAFSTIRSRVNGGILDTSRFGFNTNMTQATVTDTIVRKCTEAGLGWTRGSQGHADYVVLEDNTVGLLISEASRVHTVAVNFKRNKYGIRTQTGGTFNQEGGANIMNVGTADANTIAPVWSGALSGDGDEIRMALGELRVAYDRITRTHTGTTAETTLSTVGTIKAGRLTGAGKKARVQVVGVFGQATAGTTVTAGFGGMKFSVVLKESVPSAVFDFTAELYEVQGGYRAFGALRAGVSTQRLDMASSGFDRNADQAVTVGVKLADAADSVTLLYLYSYSTKIMLTTRAFFPLFSHIFITPYYSFI